MAEVTPLDAASMLETVVVAGDLAQLTPAQRLEYYRRVCRSLGLNPLTKPFEYLRLNGRLVLYATRNATDQLRQRHGISLEIVRREQHDDVYVVVARATTPTGRTDEAIGAVSVRGKTGDDLANAWMRAETKAKRRVTLSIVGLSFLDETETAAIPDAEPVTVDPRTGEILDGKAAQPSRSPEAPPSSSDAQTPASPETPPEAQQAAPPPQDRHAATLIASAQAMGLTEQDLRSVAQEHLRCSLEEAARNPQLRNRLILAARDLARRTRGEAHGA